MPEWQAGPAAAEARKVVRVLTKSREGGDFVRDLTKRQAAGNIERRDGRAAVVVGVQIMAEERGAGLVLTCPLPAQEPVTNGAIGQNVPLPR